MSPHLSIFPAGRPRWPARSPRSIASSGAPGRPYPPPKSNGTSPGASGTSSRSPRSHEAGGTVDDSVRAQCRDILGGWLFRSRYFNRSFHKPHGYAGDFMIIEWIYDLETDGCEDPAQPGIVNCLDYLYSTIHAVVSVQQRRRWFSRLLHAETRPGRRSLRVLDVACGGARYIRDFLAATDDASGMQITLVDQDVAALAYCRTRSLGAMGLPDRDPLRLDHEAGQPSAWSPVRRHHLLGAVRLPQRRDRAPPARSDDVPAGAGRARGVFELSHQRPIAGGRGMAGRLAAHLQRRSAMRRPLATHAGRRHRTVAQPRAVLRHRRGPR